MSGRKRPLVVVAGVTASGKTSLGIRLCERFQGEVVSADSMQIYQGMEIATAAPTAAERAAAPHHLVGFLPPGEPFSVADWAARARPLIARLHEAGKLPVVVGGTGLYLSALMDNLDFDGFSGDPILRERLYCRAQEEGKEALYQELRRVDPPLAEKLHPNNLGRLVRALEVYEATGEPMSVHQRRAKERGACYALCALAIGYADRERMRERIDRRVDGMLAGGLVEEARRFYQACPGPTAAAAIGYKELKPYLSGEEELETAVSRLKTRTYQYAKRQLTWLRRDARYHWLLTDRLGPDGVFESACRWIEESGIL
ncbi:MAG: tRNA (adenosine(37)-N6)-dimethylallyltransferase MiaA [Provencibacterium sp.]|nr:tRNA (adenosine(37)-N6)-dimethylallyltransferase MiaA [Provencibacterium sp.]